MKLENEFTLLEFSAEGNLLRLASKLPERDFLAEGGCPLFRLTLVETYHGKVEPGELHLVPETAESVQFSTCGNTLRIRFCRLDGMEITATAEVDLHGASAEWRLSVENRTDFAVRQIEYPWFLFRTPLGRNPESERILLPKQDGVLLGNPVLHPWRKDENGIPAERYWYPGEGKQWPRNLSVQMTAYYDDASGILIYTADPQGHPKRFGPVLAAPDQVDLAPVHLRPEIGGLDFTLEYPVVTRFFTGDWQAAALAYREWAATAPWCAKTVAERDDIPDWMKQGAFFLSFRLRYQQGGEAFLDRVPEFVASWREKLGLPAVAMMCGWEKIGEWAGPDYFPPYGGDARFARMCRWIAEQGDRTFTFGLSGMKLLIRRHVPKSGPQPELAVDYDARDWFRSQAVHAAALSPDGVPVVDSDLDAWDGVHAYACPATEQAMEQICGASLKMLRDYGVTVQQADQVLGGGTAPCYSTEHGHPQGWGCWQIEAVQRIYDETRRQCKAVNPDFVLSEEWISEPFIQHLDLYHARNYDKPQGGLESVPLFSFLYHEYIPCYAGDWTPMLPCNESGVHFFGWNFVAGNLPAGSPIDMMGEMENHPVEDADPNILTMARNACAAFAVRTDYLVKGRMLPTPPLDVPSLRMTIKGLDFGWSRPEIAVPAVLHQFWENPVGERACMLANISGQSQTVRIPAAALTAARRCTAETMPGNLNRKVETVTVGAQADSDGNPIPIPVQEPDSGLPSGGLQLLIERNGCADGTVCIEDGFAAVRLAPYDAVTLLVQHPAL